MLEVLQCVVGVWAKVQPKFQVSALEPFARLCHYLPTCYSVQLTWTRSINVRFWPGLDEYLIRHTL